ncbi:hypothetical protein ASF83_07070 [Plantibacter sp. Leaf171]|uniref:DUF445 domain-containing protein n=1 Tax=unclassified Plantibacter TaxID=2624265 RepID=UPI0006FD9E0F|nr:MULTISPECIES: DUF445 domain-containing protein [unclassified Plantibacter]KQM15694.1 hypothetical protein ASE44_07085 [Plantibacter sp. Leaf1]KQQ51786.1 hypothetical protein ASF68_05050 [Plantibacter sp. Leaf314]KQR58838.1 hypothetical protein ASF83_07070 [Plantibacter sp. Leaf171]
MTSSPALELTAADADRARALRSMKRLATGLLLVMAVIFAVAFALEGRYPWLAYVRAASEGGMVGALADWFAVTALFRHPLGIPIPHTAIIPKRKDEIGVSLGEFVEDNFLSEEVVRQKLATVSLSEKLGGWLSEPANAERVTAEASVAVRGLLETLSDDDVREVIEALASKHLIDPQWAPNIGRWVEHIVGAGAHHDAVDLLLDRTGEWLGSNPKAFERLVSSRLPTWVPSFVDRLVDDKLYREAVSFVHAVRADPDHQLRHALDGYLAELAEQLQTDESTIARFENAKHEVIDSPRVREVAGKTWTAAKTAFLEALDAPDSELRKRVAGTIADVGRRLSTDEAFATRVDTRVADALSYVVTRYRHDIASIITETVERWDARETTQKIELLVGRDLQFIRLNGTIVGALAGLAIFTIAQAVLRAF